MLKWSFGGFTLIIKRQHKSWTTEELAHEQWLREVNDQILDRRSKAMPYI